jgi:hypothetical protein
MIDISGKKLTRKNLTSYINKIKPTFIMINGHGSDDVVCGQNDEVLVRKGDNDGIFKDTVVYARSCSSAVGLGRSCSKNYNTTYIGYSGDYWFMFEEEKLFHPLQDETAKKFLDPSNYIAIALLKGFTAQEANEKSKHKIKDTILKLFSGTAAGEDQSVLPLMTWNYNHQVCLGDGDARVR